jgi:uroporphyrinogen-III synthase
VTRRLFVLRPEPRLAATVADARVMGFEVVACPIAEVVPVAWAPPGDTDFDALLIGSANALRHAGGALARWRGRTAHVVGAATGQAARQAGLRVGVVGTGGLQALVESLAGTGQRLLRLAGEAHVPLAPPADVSILTRVVYRVDYLPLAPALAGQFARGGVVLLHSGEAAGQFARECQRLGLDRSRLTIAALAPRIAAAAGLGWATVASAPEPTDVALLALARDLCQ